MSYEDALKKAGVQIKNDIATIIESGEKYTGKIQRFENRNRKETVEFVNGVIKEKIYYDAFGKELSGYFYKDGVLQLRITTCSYDRSQFAYYNYVTQDGTAKDKFKCVKGSFFNWAREYTHKSNC